MALHITCSDYGLGLGNIFDKITQEYDPPSFWFRLEISASSVIHKNCSGEIMQVWTEHGREVNGIDPIKMFWISEPVNDVRKEKADHYSPIIYPKKPEMTGFLHIKLQKKYRDTSLEVPENNTPDYLVPEIKIDCSRQENKLASKKMSLPYGIYYFSIMVMDEGGESVSELFKVWAFSDPKKCSIRKAWFFERWKISAKDFLGGVNIGTGLPKKKKKIMKKKPECASQKFKKDYKNKILEVLY